jgi:hypothetical protein
MTSAACPTGSISLNVLDSGTETSSTASVDAAVGSVSSWVFPIRINGLFRTGGTSASHSFEMAETGGSTAKSFHASDSIGAADAGFPPRSPVIEIFRPTGAATALSTTGSASGMTGEVFNAAFEAALGRKPSPMGATDWRSAFFRAEKSIFAMDWNDYGIRIPGHATLFRNRRQKAENEFVRSAFFLYFIQFSV